VEKHIVPLRGNVVVRRIDSMKKTPAGLFVPETAQKLKNQGVVAAAGLGRITDDGKTLDPQCAEGDEVVFRDGGIEVEQAGETFIVLDERMVIGKVVGD
jgi:chaperonin GroES